VTRAHPNLSNRLRLFEALSAGERILFDVAVEFGGKLQAVRNLAGRMKDVGLIEETDRRVPRMRTRYYRLTERGRLELERLRRDLA